MPINPLFNVSSTNFPNYDRSISGFIHKYKNFDNNFPKSAPENSQLLTMKQAYNNINEIKIILFGDNTSNLPTKDYDKMFDDPVFLNKFHETFPVLKESVDKFYGAQRTIEGLGPLPPGQDPYHLMFSDLSGVKYQDGAWIDTQMT